MGGALDPVLAGLFIAAYVLVQIGIGIYAARGVKNEDDFFVGGRRIGLVPITISLFATWFGAETLMGSTAAIASGGMAESRAEPFGYGLCLVAMGLVFAARFRAKGYVTIADFFKARFDRTSEVATAAIMAIVSVIWAGAQLVAFAAILESVLGIPAGITLFAATAIVLLYTTMSGVVGDIATDVVQSIVLLIGVALLFIAVMMRFGGLDAMLSSIEPEQLNLLGDGETWLSRADAWAIPILGSLIAQEAISRMLSTRSPQDARIAAFGAGGLYVAVGAAPLLIALAGVHLAPLGWDGGDDFLPRLAAESLHPLLYLVFIGAIMSALLSTVNSNLLSVSSLITVNLLGAVHERAGPRTRLILARAATIAAGVAACLVAAAGASIRDLISLTSVFGQAGILVAVLIGLNSRFGGPLAALSALAVCVAANVYTLLWWPMAELMRAGETLAAAFSVVLADEGPAFEGYFLFSLAASLIAYWAAALWERRRPAAAQ